MANLSLTLVRIAREKDERSGGGKDGVDDLQSSVVLFLKPQGQLKERNKK